MKFVWLSLLALVLTGINFLYLSRAVKEEDPEKAAASQKKLFIYCLIILLVLAGLGVELLLVFPQNLLIQNIRLMILLACLFAAAYVDAHKQIIPNKLVAAALIVRLLLYVPELLILKEQFWSIIKSDLFALIIPLALFIIGVLLMKNGMGMGDIKLLIVICFYLGLQGSVSAVFFSLIVAFVISIVLMIAKKKGRKDSIPFAPALLIGTAISLFMSGM